METLFVRKQETIKAIEITESITSIRLHSFFKDLGFELTYMNKTKIKPFLSELEQLELVLCDSEKFESTIRCFYNEYICLQDEAFVVKTKAEFEREFEPIEPILDNLAYQLSLMG